MHIGFVGHVCIDRNVTRGTERVSYGGGVLHGAITARRLGAVSYVHTVCAPGDRKHFAALQQAGVATTFLPSGATTSIRNEYPSDDPDERRSFLVGRGRPFDLADVAQLPACDILHINPLWWGEFPAELVAAAKQRAGALAGDAQGFLRRVGRAGALELGDWPDKPSVLPWFDFFKADSGEAHVLTGEADLEAAGRRLCELGAGTVVLTHRAGVLVTDGHRSYEAPFTSCTPAGRTGRGDTCMAAFLVAQAERSVRDAAQLAAEVTSRKMQHPGPYRG